MNDYIGHRMMLISALSILDHDNCWKKVKSRARKIESSRIWHLKRLMAYSCEPPKLPANTDSSLTESRVQVTQASKSRIATAKKSAPERATATSPVTAGMPKAPGALKLAARLPFPPESPGTLSISPTPTPIYAISLIVDALLKLDDPELLGKARRGSWLIDHSIFRWQFFQNQVMGGQQGKESILEQLNIEDVRKLANYEFLDIKGKISEGSGDITLYPTIAKLHLSGAIVLVEATILVLCFYFWMFQREAMRCDSFPGRGTLFGVFYSSLISRVSFLFLALTPAITAAWLAWESRTDSYVNLPIATLTAILSFSIALPCLRYLLLKRF